MKKTIALFVAIMALCCVATAVGCGTVNETTRATTNATQTTTSTTQTTEKTSSVQTTQTTRPPETETTYMTDTTLDPMLPLPDLDDPIIDIEPNVPDSGTTDNGALGDIFEDNNIVDGIEKDMKSRKNNTDSREKHHKNRFSDRMTTTK